nr:MAG TPA: hypothetical protein [Caudoviricetes sp.]DAZ70144.1 MAG TPA: hypothetical protein [Caudoviricetes sp.]
MEKIECRGEVMLGYVPSLPKEAEKHSERLCLILVP